MSFEDALLKKRHRHADSYSDKKTLEFDRNLNELGIRIKDANDRKVWGSCIDDSTLRALYYFAKRGMIQSYGGVVNAGKEANVFHAISPDGAEIAVKIYRITSSDFKAMDDYIVGDPRFTNIKRDKRSIVFAWTKKEFKNLTKATEVGVSVPKPIAYEKNVLLMEFIGVDGIAAQKIKDVERELNKTEIMATFEEIVGYIRTLYRDAKLVHSDLSEYNILYFGGLVLIDMAQAVPLEHPKAEQFLQRDVDNIVNFYSKLGLKRNSPEILKKIRGR